jgi:hypothetical protein
VESGYFAKIWKSSSEFPLLEEVATQIRIDQPAFNIGDGLQQGGVRDASFPSPAIKYPCLENSHG